MTVVTETFVFRGSSMLDSATYDPELQQLTLTFSTNGDTYQYNGVPESIYRGLTLAASPGSYFYRHIKNLYGYDLV